MLEIDKNWLKTEFTVESNTYVMMFEAYLDENIRNVMRKSAATHIKNTKTIDLIKESQTLIKPSAFDYWN